MWVNHRDSCEGVKSLENGDLCHAWSGVCPCFIRNDSFHACLLHAWQPELYVAFLAKHALPHLLGPNIRPVIVTNTYKVHFLAVPVRVGWSWLGPLFPSHIDVRPVPWHPTRSRHGRCLASALRCESPCPHAPCMLPLSPPAPSCHRLVSL